MVQLFKLEKLEEERRRLVAQSELNRELLKGDVVELKGSVEKLRSSWKKWAAVAAIAGFLVMRRGSSSGSKPGIFSRLMSGFRMGSELSSVLKSFIRPRGEAAEDEGQPESRI